MFACVTTRFVIDMLPALPCSRISALASRFCTSASVKSPTSTSAWRICATSALRPSICAVPMVAFSIFASAISATAAVRFWILAQSMSASPRCALAISATSAASVPICAQSMFAFSMFAVVICARAMLAMPAYSSSVVIFPATISVIYAFSAVMLLAESCSTAAVPMCAYCTASSRSCAEPMAPLAIFTVFMLWLESW